MKFGMKFTMVQGYLHAKFCEDPCRDKIPTGKNVQNLPWAVDLASLNILKNSFSGKILGSIPTKVVPTVFFLLRHHIESEN